MQSDSSSLREMHHTGGSRSLRLIIPCAHAHLGGRSRGAGGSAGGGGVEVEGGRSSSSSETLLSPPLATASCLASSTRSTSTSITRDASSPHTLSAKRRQSLRSSWSERSALGLSSQAPSSAASSSLAAIRAYRFALRPPRAALALAAIAPARRATGRLDYYQLLNFRRTPEVHHN
eukprot:scaffold23151_cov35-Tisochrysis_lutea.AAC.2